MTTRRYIGYHRVSPEKWFGKRLKSHGAFVRHVGMGMDSLPYALRGGLLACSAGEFEGADNRILVWTPALQVNTPCAPDAPVFFLLFSLAARQMSMGWETGIFL